MLTNDDFATFVRTPFVVRATKITPDNIEDVAKMIGEVRIKSGEKFIALDRRVVPNVSRAFVGWWVTVLNGNIRCYAPKVFEEQFEAAPLDGVFTFNVVSEEVDLPYITSEPE